FPDALGVPQRIISPGPWPFLNYANFRNWVTRRKEQMHSASLGYPRLSFIGQRLINGIHNLTAGQSLRRNSLSLTLLFVTLALSLVAAAEVARPANEVTSNATPPKIATTGDASVYHSSYQSP